MHALTESVHLHHGAYMRVHPYTALVALSLLVACDGGVTDTAGPELSIDPHLLSD